MTESAFDSADVEPEVFTAWVAGLPQQQPPERLRRQVLARIRGDTARMVRREEGWIAFATGIQIKMLYRDEPAGMVSCLARLDPGVALPAHFHELAEEQLVLEGDLLIGEELLLPGDYHVARAGADHGIVKTQHGALLYLRAAMGQHVPEPPQ